MQVFAKRVWGFDPVNWPIIPFGLEGNRDALLRASQPGDLVVFIGTKEEPTAAEDRGRLLGLLEIGRIPIDSLSVLDPSILRPFDYGADGKFKWPKAITIVRAWRFPAKPLVTEVLQRQLTFEATARAVLLNERDQAAVLRVPREPVEVPDLEVIRRLRDLNDTLSRSRGPTKGPTPNSWSGTVVRDASSAGTTYAFRFGKRNVWKIGCSQDVKTRLAEMNQHIPFEVLEEQWSVTLRQEWPDQMGAYQMEQRVLSLLSPYRTIGERVICPSKELEEAWIAALVPVR